MTQQDLLTALAYTWTAFGAYWIVIAPRGATVAHPNSRLRSVVLALGFVLLLYVQRVVSTMTLVGLIFAWTIGGLYWDGREEKGDRFEHGIFRLLRLTILASTFMLLFWRRTAIGFLGQGFVPISAATALTGFVIALAGLALALWARTHLAEYWSDKVVLQSKHQLIRSGPYVYMRHPIYSGVLLAVLGTAVVVGQCRGLIAFAMLFTNYVIKAKREERILSARFPDEFQQHRRTAGFLLPYFHRRTPA